MDVLHGIAGGVFKDNEMSRIREDLKKQVFANSKRLKYTNEKRGISDLSLSTSFGSMDYAKLLLFGIFPLCEEIGVEEEQLLRFSILAEFFERLNSKITPVNKEILEYLQKSILYFINKTPLHDATDKNVNQHFFFKKIR